MSAASVTKLHPEPVEPLAKLREPFAPHHISKLPKPTKKQTEEVRADFKKGIRCKDCGAWHHPDVVHLDYVGHAALTDRLLDTDSHWSWEPVAFRDGLPAFDSTGGLWIKLTVCGVTRLGYGHAEAKPNQDAGAREKEVIGDALRNAAMRFGAALDLWHKGDLHASDDGDTGSPPREPSKAPTQAKPVTLKERADKLERALKAAEATPVLRKVYDLASGLCAELDEKDPERLAELEALYERRFDELETAVAKPDLGIGADKIPY